MKIVVLAGGLSTERDVSFKTGEMVTKALRENGHQVILLDVFMDIAIRKKILPEFLTEPRRSASRWRRFRRPRRTWKK